MNPTLIFFLFHLIMGLVTILLPNVTSILLKKAGYLDNQVEYDLYISASSRKKKFMYSLVATILYVILTFWLRTIFWEKHTLISLLWLGTIGTVIAALIMFEVDDMKRLIPHGILLILLVPISIISTIIFFW